MLSKQHARFFFLSGTIFFFGIFLYLTYDMIVNHLDKQTNTENLTESVVRGKEIFDKNNCMGCHTIMGEGGYYAPELTKVIERRGEEWIKIFIKDPQAMYPGKRKMPKYDFTEQEVEDLLSFFTWIGEMDLNGFPPEPDL